LAVQYDRKPVFFFRLKLFGWASMRVGRKLRLWRRQI
jgi:hypothetical protein